MTRAQRELIEDHAFRRAESSAAWYRERGAYYDSSIRDWIPLSEDGHNIIKNVLETMAEELPLDMPNLNAFCPKCGSKLVDHVCSCGWSETNHLTCNECAADVELCECAEDKNYVVTVEFHITVPAKNSDHAEDEALSELASDIGGFIEKHGSPVTAVRQCEEE